MRQKSNRRIIKGWYVDGVLPTDPEGTVPHRLSRLYHSREAAIAYAMLARDTLPHPEVVNVRSKVGYDDASDL